MVYSAQFRDIILVDDVLILTSSSILKLDLLMCRNGYIAAVQYTIPSRYEFQEGSIMNSRALFAAFVFCGAIVSVAAHATDLAPTAARLVKLGPISALTYYTVEKDGFRVVTTIQSDDAAESDAHATPVRF